MFETTDRCRKMCGPDAVFIYILVVLFITCHSSAGAFDTVGNGFGSKWDDPNHGTPATIQWSFMTPGVALPPDNSPPVPDAWNGTNSLGSSDALSDIRVKIDDEFGVGSFDAAVRNAFATWASATQLTFEEVADNGGDFAADSTPDIRIGAFHFDVNDLAAGAGFGPPGDDLNFPDALAGDIALNDLNRFTIAPGGEGSPVPTDNNVVQNDVQSLMLHEIGHTLGLRHSDVTTSVMCGYVSQSFNGLACENRAFVSRQLDPDDIAGIRTIYGVSAAITQRVPQPMWFYALLFFVIYQAVIMNWQTNTARNSEH